MRYVKFVRAALLAPVCLSLAGCAFRSRLEGVAVNHNEMVANTVNQLALLNILRAKEREPLHFTSISKLNGSATAVGKASGNVAAKGKTPTIKTDAAGKLVETSTAAGAEVVTPALEASVTAASAFDVAVFDTQEFYQGILGSVPSGIVAHYLHQGWPEELLTSLFISSVDFVATSDVDGKDGKHYKKGQALRSISNDPRRRSENAPIRAFLNCYRLISYSRETPARRLVQVKQVDQLDLLGLALLDGEKYDVEDPGAADAPKDPADRWISRKAKSSDALMLELVGKADDCKALLDVSSLLAKADQLDAVAVDLGGRRGAQSDQQAQVAALRYTFKTQVDKSAEPKTGEAPILIEVQLTIRSIDGVIYFLGECLRKDGVCPASVGAASDRLPLLVVSDEKPSAVFTSAKFRGETYYVPAGQTDGGRSSQVFALIEQLVNLQKSSKDRPSTQTVRVVQ